ncbi:hypothetical protein [Cupriavidus numazuensis]|uniref:Uncharacterized protein n=1 Tax=Cupriavidus numazuensis TaxID=221992 RepID=A0ABN7PQZ7_9BURK|nr:hypothetical protein [Cupriavidus numazuensis]CAG2132259.1 hypothetical protein LMG26411_00584 [Cupriavidus numazuensis]
MSPSEIISRIHPNERTRFLIALVAIDSQDQGMEPDSRQLMQLARYTELRDKIVAQANASLERDQEVAAGARAAVERAMSAPGTVMVSTRRDGKSEVRTVRGTDVATVQARARALVANIDAFRSPSLNELGKDSHGRHVVEVRCHGLD